MNSRKGAGTIISTVALAGVTLAAVGVVLNVSGPSIEEARDAAAIDRSVSFMNNVDNQIRQVASEGQGSTRTVTLDFDRGEFTIDPTNDNFFYSLKTRSESISPQSSTTIGDVKLASNAEVTVEETTIGGEECYMMENSKVETCIRKVGSEGSPQNINTSNLLTHYKVKNGEELEMNLQIELNDQFLSSYGQGYTEVEEIGDRLTKGEATAHVESENGYQYRILMELYAGADFLSIRVLPAE